MLVRYYELACDYCLKPIKKYYKKPEITRLVYDGVKMYGRKHFCSEICRDEYIHDLKAKRYCNLKQNGKIHNNE